MPNDFFSLCLVVRPELLLCHRANRSAHARAHHRRDTRCAIDVVEKLQPLVGQFAPRCVRVVLGVLPATAHY